MKEEGEYQISMVCKKKLRTILESYNVPEQNEVHPLTGMSSSVIIETCVWLLLRLFVMIVTGNMLLKTVFFLSAVKDIHLSATSLEPRRYQKISQIIFCLSRPYANFYIQSNLA